MRLGKPFLWNLSFMRFRFVLVFYGEILISLHLLLHFQRNIFRKLWSSFSFARKWHWLTCWLLADVWSVDSFYPMGWRIWAAFPRNKSLLQISPRCYELQHYFAAWFLIIAFAVLSAKFSHCHIWRSTCARIRLSVFKQDFVVYITIVINGSLYCCRRQLHANRSRDIYTTDASGVAIKSNTRECSRLGNSLWRLAQNFFSS